MPSKHLRDVAGNARARASDLKSSRQCRDDERRKADSARARLASRARIPRPPFSLGPSAPRHRPLLLRLHPSALHLFLFPFSPGFFFFFETSQADPACIRRLFRGMYSPCRHPSPPVPPPAPIHRRLSRRCNAERKDNKTRSGSLASGGGKGRINIQSIK